MIVVSHKALHIFCFIREKSAAGEVEKKTSLICNKSNGFFPSCVRLKLVRSLLIHIYFSQVGFCIKKQSMEKLHHILPMEKHTLERPPKSSNTNMDENVKRMKN